MITLHPGHGIQVTGGGPFGRAWFECSCGIERRLASKHAANVAALMHHHEVGGCNCPPEVVARDVHPQSSGPGSPAPVTDRTHDLCGSTTPTPVNREIQ